MEGLTRAELQAMLKEIDTNYAQFNLPEIEPIYIDGKLANKKAIDEKLKTFATLLSALWLANKLIIDKYSKRTMFTVINYYTAKKQLKGYSTTEITNTMWNSIIDKTMLKRAKKVQIKQVINGNSRRLNKRLQKTVKTMYANGKSKPQIAKELQKQLGYNKKKAKSIAITEVNYYKSEAQLQATKDVPVKKTWIHNGSREPRASHLSANGQVADKDGYFNIGGNLTKAPQHFGLPSEDINCRCGMRIDII